VRGLHALRWERLRRPDEDAAITTSERILFSRYLSSADWRRVRLRPLSELRALVVIANPANLAEYQLALIDVDTELQRIVTALGGMPVISLVSNQPTHQPTLNQLTNRLRDQFDILYLVGHGAFVEGKPHLWLADETGNAQVVDGQALVQRINELP